MELDHRLAFLEFRHPFGIAHGTRTGTPAAFVRIGHQGLYGYGEASMPPYLGESHRTAREFYDKAKKTLASVAELNIEKILSETDSLCEGNTAARASIDMALHDLLGKISGMPLHRLWKITPAQAIHSSYTIGFSSKEELQQKVNEASAHRILKIKLGSGNDRQIIETVRSLTDKPLSVDVNGGWTDTSFALDMAQWMKEKEVLFIEQPFAKDNLDDHAWLTERSPLPVIADESCQRLHDVKKLRGVFSGINIKLMKCTGLNEARKMIEAAKGSGMQILLGCMSETSCAVSAAAQIASLCDWVDLDGPLLIKKDYFSGVRFSAGSILLNERPGIGAEPIGNIF